MRSPVPAILWEQWRRTRPILVVAFAGGALLAGNILSIRLHRPDVQLTGNGSLALGCVASCLAAMLVAFSHGDTNNLQAGLPPRILALPVRTATLAACYMGYRVVFLALLISLVSGLICLASVGLPDLNIQFAIAAGLAILAAFVYMQALLWTVGLIHLGLAAAAAALLAVPTIVGVDSVFRALGAAFSEYVLLMDLGGNVKKWAPAFWGYILVAGAIILLCAGIGFAGLCLERRGVWAAVRARLSSLGSAKGQRPKRSLASSAHGQHWFEWRRRGLVLPIATGGALMALVQYFGILLYTANVRHELKFAPDDFFGFGIFALQVGAAIGGMILPLFELRDRATHLSLFTMTRPVNTRVFAMERLKVTALSVGWTYAAVAVVVLVCVGVTGKYNELWESLSWIGSGWNWLVVPFAVLGHMLVLWCVLSFMVPLLALFVAAECAVGIVYLPSEMVELAVGIGIGFSMVCLAGIIAYAGRQGYRLGLFDARDFRRAVVALPLVVACLSALVYLVMLSNENPTDMILGPMLIATPIMTLACYAGVFATPVYLDWLRHR